jgi:hypothetical protein
MLEKRCRMANPPPGRVRAEPVNVQFVKIYPAENKRTQRAAGQCPGPEVKTVRIRQLVPKRAFGPGIALSCAVNSADFPEIGRAERHKPHAVVRCIHGAVIGVLENLIPLRARCSFFPPAIFINTKIVLCGRKRLSMNG